MVGLNTIYRKAFLLCSVLVSREKCRSVLGLSGNEERDSDVIDIYVNYDDLTSLDIDYSQENTDYSLDVVSSKIPLMIFCSLNLNNSKVVLNEFNNVFLA